MKLRKRVRKATGSGAHREVTTEETWRRVRPHLRRAGITRLADITGLDCVGVPVYSAIIPRSNDSISVYSAAPTSSAVAPIVLRSTGRTPPVPLPQTNLC
ncbi:hypothetical protein AB0K09_27095, partial [Streptomyces sp. NPDC049577]